MFSRRSIASFTLCVREVASSFFSFLFSSLALKTSPNQPTRSRTGLKARLPPSSAGGRGVLGAGLEAVEEAAAALTEVSGEEDDGQRDQHGEHRPSPADHLLVVQDEKPPGAGLVTPALTGIAVRAVDRLEFFQRPARTDSDAR